MTPGADSVVGNPQGLSDWYWNHGGRSRCKQVSRHYQGWKIPQPKTMKTRGASEHCSKTDQIFLIISPGT